MDRVLIVEVSSIESITRVVGARKGVYWGLVAGCGDFNAETQRTQRWRRENEKTERTLARLLAVREVKDRTHKTSGYGTDFC
jgi:hypothetical protein